MVRTNLSDYSFEAPKIKINPPGPKSKELLLKQEILEGKAVSYPKGIPVAFKKGKGATIQDVDGNVFIDFFGGAGVLNVGHCNPDVVQAVIKQVQELTHSLDFPTEIRAELVAEILSTAPGTMKEASKLLFGGPTGSDAVEFSMKLAKYNTKRHGFIAFMGSYHGMTAGALSLTADKPFKEKYLPMISEVHFVPYAYCYRCPFGLEHPGCGIRCASYLEYILDNPNSGIVDPAAIIIEPIQGEGGSIVPPERFIREIRRITDEYSVPLIIDEIQSGVGRTGKMWSCEHSDTDPDIMTISKGIGGGLPLSGILYKNELDTWKPGSHIGTFRGHLTAMAAGVAALRFMKKYNLIEHASLIGEYILKRLKEEEENIQCIGDSRGLGLMLGIEFVKDKRTKEPWPEITGEIRLESYKKGLIVEKGGNYGNVIRFLPPLVLTKELASNGVDVFLDAITTVMKKY
jgi:diaminobutyrate-2-oxoglutarate transaminase